MLSRHSAQKQGASKAAVGASAHHADAREEPIGAGTVDDPGGDLHETTSMLAMDYRRWSMA